MKDKRILVSCMVVLISLLAFTSCGSNSSEAGLQSTGVQADATPEEEVVEQTLAEADIKADAADLTGNWIDVSEESRFVNITQNGEEYTYEDNEGVLQAAFKDGVLEVKVTGIDTARVYLDQTTGHLMFIYQDNVSEYRKK
jgi:hypothetical protein